MMRRSWLLILLAGAGCTPSTVSLCTASQALVLARQADNAVRVERQSREHEKMLRQTWGIETESAAAPWLARSGDTGTAREFGDWDR